VTVLPASAIACEAGEGATRGDEITPLTAVPTTAAAGCGD
jgi:hypothetical protein